MTTAVAGMDGLPSAVNAQDRVLLTLEVKNVDEACAVLEAKGVTILVPPTDHPAQPLRTAHFRDPDGNLIAINHPIPMGES